MSSRQKFDDLQPTQRTEGATIARKGYGIVSSHLRLGEGEAGMLLTVENTSLCLPMWKFTVF